MPSNIVIGLCAGLLALVAAPLAAPAQNAPAAPAPAAPAPVMEPKAIEVLKAASDKLAAANTLEFTAVSTYERAARNGQPLYYSLVHQVTVERSDKMRVITPGDGTPDEFYYDGKTMMAYVPSSNLVAVADAPSTIDKLIDAAWDKAAIYFPFSDIIASDPYAELSKTLKSAFYVAGAHDQKLAQVSVAHLGDAPEPRLAAGRALARRQAEIWCSMSSAATSGSGRQP